MFFVLFRLAATADWFQQTTTVPPAGYACPVVCETLRGWWDHGHIFASFMRVVGVRRPRKGDRRLFAAVPRTDSHSKVGELF
jgi:hypothetical protein